MALVASRPLSIPFQFRASRKGARDGKIWGIQFFHQEDWPQQWQLNSPIFFHPQHGRRHFWLSISQPMHEDVVMMTVKMLWRCWSLMKPSYRNNLLCFVFLWNKYCPIKKSYRNKEEEQGCEFYHSSETGQLDNLTFSESRSGIQYVPTTWWLVHNSMQWMLSSIRLKMTGKVQEPFGALWKPSCTQWIVIIPSFLIHWSWSWTL